MTPSHPATPRLTGFTLLELTVVFVILALVTTMGLTAAPEVMEAVRQGETEQKLTTIETALKKFVEVYNSTVSHD